MNDPVNHPDHYSSNEIAEWKDITGFEGLYQVSSLGEVRNTRTGKHRVLGDWGGNYLTINLYRDAKSKIISVHRLVAETFLPPPINKKYIVNHINGHKKDNRLVNLEWCSYAQNNLHAFDIGLQKRIVRPSKTTKSLQQRARIAIKKLSANGVCHDLLADAFNITRISVDAISRHG